MSEYKHKKGYSSSRRSPYRERSRSRSPSDDRRGRDLSPPRTRGKNNDDRLIPARAPPPPLISKPPVEIPKFKPPKIGIQLKLNSAPKKESTKNQLKLQVYLVMTVTMNPRKCRLNVKCE